MTAQLNTLVRNANIETLATILVGLAFGWSAEETETVVEDNPTALDVVVFFHGNLDSLTVAQLRQVASGYRIKGCWKMRKADLCRALANVPAEEQDIELLRTIESEDKEVEKFHVYTEKVVAWDENDMAVEEEVEFLVPTWAYGDITPHGTSSYGETEEGWAGVAPHLAQLESNKPVKPSGNIEGFGAVADWDRTGCGFLPEELTGSGDDLDYICKSIIGTCRREAKQARIKRCRNWTQRVQEARGDLKRLARIRRNIWKNFYADKEQGACYLTQDQLKRLGKSFRDAGSQLSKNL